METDYKIVQILDNGNGASDVTVRYYEGVTSTQDEIGEDLTLTPVTRYRRSAKVAEITYTLEDIAQIPTTPNG